MDSEIVEMHYHLHTAFCTGANFWNHPKWWNARCSHPVLHLFWYM